MGPWRSIRHRLEETVRASSAEASGTSAGRGRRARARAIRPRTRSSRTASSGRLSGARRRGPRLHCGVARDPSERINGEPMAVDTSIPENPFTTDASAEDDASSLARAIQEHLDLKQRNADLDGDMPLDRYSIEDPFENHPLFKSEEQARLEETLDGVAAPEPSPAASRGRARTRRSRARRSTRGSGVARATSTGASSPRGHARGRDAVSSRAVTPDDRLDRFADLAVRVGANVQPGQDVVLIYLVEHTPDRARGRARGLRAGARRVLPVITDLHLRKRRDRARPGGGARRDAGAHPRLGSHAGARHVPRSSSSRATPSPTLFAGLDPALVGTVGRRRTCGRSTSRSSRSALDQLGDRPRARTPGWAEVVLRRAGRRAPLGRRRDGDAARRGRSRRGVARPRRDARRRVRDALNERALRRDPVPGAGNGSRRRAAPRRRAGCARRSRRTTGIEHIPNLPTEEVFTTPDWRRADGVVRSTYPLVLPGVGALVSRGSSSASREARSWRSRRTATARR